MYLRASVANFEVCYVGNTEYHCNQNEWKYLLNKKQNSKENAFFCCSSSFYSSSDETM